MNGTAFGGSKASLSSMETIMAVVGGGHRREIVEALAAGPKNVTTIADDLELEINLISHNLGILRRHMLVEAQYIGNRRIYRLSDAVRVSFHAAALRLKIPCANHEWLVMHAHVHAGNPSRP